MNRRALLRVAAGVLGGGAATAAGLSVATGGDALARETTSDTAVLTVTRDGVEASEYGAVGGDGSLTISTE